MEMTQLLVSCGILGVLILILEELAKANREPRKAVIVPSAAWPNKKSAEMERVFGESRQGTTRMTSSEFSEAAREENLRLAREEAKRAS